MVSILNNWEPRMKKKDHQYSQTAVMSQKHTTELETMSSLLQRSCLISEINVWSWIKQNTLTNLDNFCLILVRSWLPVLILPHLTRILCKNPICDVLRLRANYKLVSFSDYHPDEDFTWLPFPAAYCNPSLPNREGTLKSLRTTINKNINVNIP